MNFQKLFHDYHINYNDRVNRGWVNVRCCWCDDKTFNGGFNSAKNYYHCWKCGGHEFYSTLSKVISVPRYALKEVLDGYYVGITEDDIYKKVAKGKDLRLPTSTFTEQERRYLIDRNFDVDYLHKKYGLVGGGLVGDWRFRIIIPLVLNGEVVSWTGRSILSKEKITREKIARYKNLSIEESVVNPKNTLFNLDHSKDKTVIVTEGAFDVMRLGDNSICSFGTEITQEQISEIAKRYEKVFILFDNEKPAQDKAKKFGLELASLGLDVEVVNAYADFNKNDAGELTDDEVRIIKNELGVK